MVYLNSKRVLSKRLDSMDIRIKEAKKTKNSTDETKC